MRRRAARYGVVLATILLLVGCAYDPAARAARLQVFVGQPAAVLVANMGVPSRSYETDGIQFLAYTERRVDYLPASPGYGYAPYGPYGPYGGIGGFPPQVVEWVCETTFQVVQDRVQSFSFRGNACG